MDIEELRARAIASMPNTKRRKHNPSSPMMSGKSYSGNNLAEAHVDQLLSSFQKSHLVTRSSTAEEKGDNLVIKFSDGESDSDSDEHTSMNNQMTTEGPSKGITVSTAVNTSVSAVNTPVSASIHLIGSTENQIQAKKQPVALLKPVPLAPSTLSSAASFQPPSSMTVGQGLSRKSSFNQTKSVVGQRSVTKVGALSAGNDLESLRKQIETKENELKLQKNLRSSKGQESKLVSEGEMNKKVNPTSAGIGRFSFSPTSSNLEEGEYIRDAEEKKSEFEKDYSSNEDSVKNLQTSSTEKGIVCNSPSEEMNLKRTRNEKELDTIQQHSDIAIMSGDKSLVESSICLHSEALSTLGSSEKISSEGLHQETKVLPEENECTEPMDLEETDAAGSLLSKQSPTEVCGSYFEITHSQELPSIKCIGSENDLSVGMRTNSGTENQQLYTVNLEENPSKDCDVYLHLVDDNVSGQPPLQDSEIRDFAPIEPVIQPEVVLKTVTNVPEKGSEVVVSEEDNVLITNNECGVSENSSDCIRTVALVDGVSQRPMSQQDLMEMWELLDKELEEAQEHRNFCKSEEQIAWKALEKAHQALQSANERCFALYKKKELLCTQALRIRDHDSMTSFRKSEVIELGLHSKETSPENHAVGTSLEENHAKSQDISHVHCIDLPGLTNTTGIFIQENDQHEAMDFRRDDNYDHATVSIGELNIERDTENDLKTTMGGSQFKQLLLKEQHPDSMNSADDNEKPSASTSKSHGHQGRDPDHLGGSSHHTGKRKFLSSLSCQPSKGDSGATHEVDRTMFQGFLNLSDNSVHQDSVGTCNSNGPLAGRAVYDRANPKRLKISTNILEGSNCNSEIDREKSDVESSMNEEYNEGKEEAEVFTNPDEEYTQKGSPIYSESLKTSCKERPSDVIIALDSSGAVFSKVSDKKGNSSRCTSFLNGDQIVPSDNMITSVDDKDMTESGQIAQNQISSQSPLDVFKTHRAYSYLNNATEMLSSRADVGYVINPFWPLCKYEHRGKCNNEECPWQHVRDYKLTSHASEQLSKYDTTSHKSEAAVDKSDSTKQKAKISSQEFALGKSSNRHVMRHLVGKYRVKVPMYKIGSHLIRADSSTTGSLIACGTWRFWKLGFCQSFSTPIAIQRILLPEMPLLYSIADKEWIPGNMNNLTTCLYSSSQIGKQDDTKNHLFRSLKDEECWLELAIDFMNGESNIEKSEGRKKALYVLSRALELNPESIMLWVAYLHIFYRKEKEVGKDDMFYHAVQHNRDSYELWLLYINSRAKLDWRANGYRRAITSMCNKTSKEENGSRSSVLLDMVLQMLNFLSHSENRHRADAWIDTLLYGNLRPQMGHPELVDIVEIFPHLCDSDACILWICCAYFRAYGRLPKFALENLECKQELPFDIEWESTEISEASSSHALRLMSLAVSKFREIEDMKCNKFKQENNSGSPSLHSLLVNHVKCVLALQGLSSARELCSEYRKLYKCSVELLFTEMLWGDEVTNLKIFNESISCWPENKFGMQRLWYQFQCHVLQTKDLESTKKICKQWFSFMNEHHLFSGGFLSSGTYELHYSCVNEEEKHPSDESSNEKIETEDKDASKINRSSLLTDKLFALLNLAVYKFFNESVEQAQTVANQILKLTRDEVDFKMYIREYARLHSLLSSCNLQEERDGVFDKRFVQVLDSCFQNSELLCTLKPLSRAFTEKIKKPKIRIFLDNLLGPIPKDCSLFNSILEVFYGKSLLPKTLTTTKDIVDFVEGCLELVPVNVRLVLSVSRLLADSRNSLTKSSLSVLLWASSALINSLFQTFPAASENLWLEAGSILNFGKENAIVNEFYEKALSIHPFSVALWRSLLKLQRHRTEKERVVEAAKFYGMFLQ